MPQCLCHANNARLNWNELTEAGKETEGRGWLRERERESERERNEKLIISKALFFHTSLILSQQFVLFI